MMTTNENENDQVTGWEWQNKKKKKKMREEKTFLIFHLQFYLQNFSFLLTQFVILLLIMSLISKGRQKEN